MYLGLEADTFTVGWCELDFELSPLVIAIPTQTRGMSVPPTVTTQFRLEISGRDPIDNVEGILGHDNTLFTMTDTLFRNITGRIPAMTATESGAHLLNNCAESRALLPTISLRFPSGELRLVPEDYTKVVAENVCEVLIGRVPQDALPINTIKMNLVLLEGINIRSTSNEILICDS
jgi:hypothetical protein